MSRGPSHEPTVVLTEPAAEFAADLTRLRLDAGLSVREVSRVTGIPSGTLGGYFSGRHLPPANRPEVLGEVVRACGGGAGDVAVWQERLREVTQGRRSTVATRAPYRGLPGFTAEDQDLFFGREELVAELVGAVDSAVADGSGLVAVVGASGSGKSSLLRAGLVPALRDRETDGWAHAVVTPGEDPAESLAPALAALEGADRAVLVVDQLEELFTLVDDEDERRSVVGSLTSWLGSGPDGGGRAVVLGLRADHYGSAAEHPDLVPALRDRQVLVGPMTRDQLRAVIERPAERVGLKLEWGLADVILTDASGEDLSELLPHLSHALQATWEHSDRRTLRIKDYKQVGGLHGSISRSAEDTYASLDGADQEVARAVLLRLIAVHPDSAPTRRTAPLPDLATLHPRALPVLDHLVRHRLVTVTQDEASLSHEALFRSWDRLREWVLQDQGGLLVREMLTRQEQVWRGHGQDPDLLLRGTQLGAAREWADRHPGELTAQEGEYLDASVRHTEERRRAQERQHRRTRRLLVATLALALVAVLTGLGLWNTQNVVAQQRDEARSRQMSTVATTLRATNLPLSGQLALAAFQTAPTREARSALLDATSTPVLTRRLDDGGEIAAAVSPSGSLAVLGGYDGTVDVVEVGPGRMTDLGGVQLGDASAESPPTVQALAFHPDEELVAVAGGAGHVRLADVSDPQRPEPVADLPAEATVFDLEFTADGAQLLAASDDGRVLRWAAGRGGRWDPLPALEAGGSSVRGVTTDPRGATVVAGTMDGDLHLWRPDESAEPVSTVRIGEGTNSQFAVDLSPDGDRLAAGGKDKTLRLFEVSADGELTEQAALEAFGSWVNTVAFSRSGDVVLGGSSDNNVRAWDVAGGSPELVRVLPTGAAVTSLVPMEGERYLITTTDNASYLWSAALGVLPLHGDNVFTIRAAREVPRMITAPGTAEARLHLWDTTDPRTPRPLTVLTAPESLGLLDGAAAISGDGTLVAGGTSTGGLVVWDVTTPSEPREVAAEQVSQTLIDYVAFVDGDRTAVAVGGDGRVSAVAVAGADQGSVTGQGDAGQPLLSVAGSGGTVLATGGIDGTTELWDVTDLDGPLATIPGENTVFGLDFSPDDRLLAVGGADSRVRVFDVSDPGRPLQVGGTLTGPPSAVYSVEFSPDGSRLAAAVTDGTVWVWQRDGEEFAVEAVLRSAPASVLAVGWSQDGEVLLAGGHEGATRMWLVDEAAAIEHVCAGTGTDTTEEEWQTQLPGVDYAPPCSRRE